jgi:hypothetical protein
LLIYPHITASRTERVCFFWGSHMTIATMPYDTAFPCTTALRRALDDTNDPRSTDDLLFLERWEMYPIPGAAFALRVAQIRRANPALAAEIRAELKRGRPLTGQERAALDQ